MEEVDVARGLTLFTHKPGWHRRSQSIVGRVRLLSGMAHRLPRASTLEVAGRWMAGHPATVEDGQVLGCCLWFPVGLVSLRTGGHSLDSGPSCRFRGVPTKVGGGSSGEVGLEAPALPPWWYRRAGKSRRRASTIHAESVCTVLSRSYGKMSSPLPKTS